MSKWSSIARLLRPVMKIMSVMPAAAASSTAYWISGLSTTGSISFGLALVAGRKRVPNPATGKTAFVIARIALSRLIGSLAGLSGPASDEFKEARLVQHGNVELNRFRKLRSGIRARHDIARLPGHAPCDLPSLLLDARFRVFACQSRQRAGQYECQP